MNPLLAYVLLREAARKRARKDKSQQPPPQPPVDDDQDRRDRYDALVRSWQTLLADLPQANLRLVRRLRPLRAQEWPDRYPAGGGYRILRKPLPEDE